MKPYEKFCQLRDHRDPGAEVPKYSEEQAFALTVAAVPDLQADRIADLDLQLQSAIANLVFNRKLVAAYQRGETPPADASGVYYDRAWIAMAPEFDRPNLSCISIERFSEKMDALDAANPGPLKRLLSAGVET